MWSRQVLRTSQRAVASIQRSSVRPAIHHCCLFHSSPFVGKDEKTPETPSQFQSISDTEYTDAEIEAMIEAEEARLQEEIDSVTNPNWKPGDRKKKLSISRDLESMLYDLEPENHPPRWTLRDKRCGALAIKVGMMPVIDDWGERHSCTVLFLDENIVIGHKTPEQHGYCAVQVAAGQRKRKNVSRALLGQYRNWLHDEAPAPYLVREFRVTETSHLLPLHSRIHARHFVPGQNVDVSGISKGKGFQGAMKRHGFGGMPSSHGVSKSHRALGSTGQCQDPGRVFKGKKMAGRMGNDKVTTQNLRVIKVDRGRNLVYVIGAVPGNKGSFVEIRDAVKKPLWKTPKVLDALDRPPLPTYAFDEAIDGCGEPGHEVFMPLPEIDPLNPELNDNEQTSI